jgi:hypothetical protein
VNMVKEISGNYRVSYISIRTSGSKYKKLNQIHDYLYHLASFTLISQYYSSVRIHSAKMSNKIVFSINAKMTRISDKWSSADWKEQLMRIFLI